MQGSRRYHIHSAIGRGAFGTVYRATLTGEGGFKKDVAVKLLNSEVDGWDEVARRLRDEARVLGLLRHRVILQVDGLVQLGGRWAVVMEYVRGVSLLQLLRRGRIPLGPCLELVSEVAGALHVAYNGIGPDGESLNLIHRDIKPSNIQVSDVGEVKLLDFGIARADFQERESETQELVLGSPGYMAPERFDMLDGPEGDVYSLGVVLCEAASGKKFGKSSANRERHVEHVDGALAKVKKKLGSDFAAVEPLLRRILHYDPSERPTAKEVERLARDLRSRVGGVWLAEWSEAHVPGAIDSVEALDGDDLAGTTLIEGRLGSEFTDEMPVVPGDPEAVGVSGAQEALEGTLPTARPEQTGDRRRYLLALLGLFLGLGGLGLVSLAAVVALQQTPEPTDSLGADDPPGQPDPSTKPDPSIDPDPPNETGSDVAIGSGGAQGSGSGARGSLDEGSGSDDGIADAGTGEAGSGAVQPPPPAAKDTPPPKPVGKKSGPVVTVAQFSAWLVEHPEWHSEAAKADGRADSNYLEGWAGSAPPAGKSGFVTGVSWSAAAAYCGSKGLPTVSSSPQEWTYQVEGPLQLWRVDDAGRPAWRQFDNTASEYKPPPSESNLFIGFRCAR